MRSEILKLTIRTFRNSMTVSFERLFTGREQNNRLPCGSIQTFLRFFGGTGRDTKPLSMPSFDVIWKPDWNAMMRAPAE